MPNKILPKSSYTANAVPLASELEENELAINWADGIAYTKNASGQIVSFSMGGGGGASSDSRWNLFLPPAPTGLAGTAGDAEVSLSWTAPTGVLAQTPITDYIVQYSSDGGSNWATFADGTSTDTTATVTGLTNDTEYTFRVAAVNGVGTGSFGDSVAATPAGVGFAGFLVSGFTGNLDGYLSDSVLNGRYVYNADALWWELVDSNGDPILNPSSNAPPTFYCNDPNCADWQFWSGGDIVLDNFGAYSSGPEDLPTTGWADLTFTPF